ncbi:hypothetical protein ASPCAL05996 [Aspergillus calidoustus]|uniref:Uncharacterized protein n=1 Tax=Aspergillus calidoustus TaxID=454130 RepID=A0A0U5G371_ASPCI|nr:hypothetical protein ASPCAL05996 [Aspergillus calidoustus]
MARLFAFVEDWLDKRSAQLFRKFQHKVFGLTDQEWDAFHTLLGSHDAMSIVVQRNRWFATNAAYFKDLERNGTSDEARDLAREAWQMYYFELKENRAVCE